MQRKVLVVDDSKVIREVVGFTLETDNYKVFYAENGQEALQHLQHNSIDLLITDLHMPVMDGNNLIKHVRKLEKYKKMPILMLTTESKKAKKMEAKHAGATGWIVKPFVPDKLKAAIKKVLR